MAVMTPFLSILEPLTERRAVSNPEWPSDADGPSASFTPEEAATLEDLTEQARQALAEAEDIRTQARAAAEEMREDARLQSEAFREAAWQEGFHEGKQTAHDQVEAELCAQWEIKQADFQSQTQALIDGILAQRQALWESQEAEMVGFVIDIARQVIKTEVTQNPEVVTSVLHNALRRITEKDHVRIRVSVADAPHIREMRDDLLTLVDGIKHLEILDDRRVGEGGCVIETGAGTIDAKIETQLAEVERTLNHAID
jgi:flagellar assembly protein FliH